MSQPIEINDDILELLILADDSTAATAKSVLLLHSSLVIWGDVAQIKEITLVRGIVDPLVYTYKVERKDGRTLNAIWTLADDKDTNPLISATIFPAWLETEIAFGSAVRRQLLEIRALVGIESVTVVFALP